MIHFLVSALFLGVLFSHVALIGGAGLYARNAIRRRELERQRRKREQARAEGLREAQLLGRMQGA